MAREGQYIAVLQWDDARIEAIRFRVERGEIEMVEHAELSRGGKDLAADLRAFSTQHGLVESRLYTVFPREEASVRHQTLPSTDAKELEGMARYAAEELTPLRPEDTTVYHRVLGQAGAGESRTLLCVVETKRLDAHLDLLERAGLYPEQILLSTDCLYDATHHLAKRSGSLLAVDIQGGRADMLLYDGGRPILDRGIPLTSASEAVDSLTREIRRTLTGTELQASPAYVIGGATDARQGLLNALDGADVVESSDAVPARLRSGQETLHGTPLTLIGACVAVSSEDGARRGLLPAKELRRRRMGSTQRTARMVAVAALVSIVAIGMAFGLAVRQRTAYIATIESQIEALRPEAQAVAAKRRQLAQLNRAVRGAADPHLLLAEVMEQAPEQGVNLSHFRYDVTDGIDIRGRATDLIFVDEFLDNLTRRGAADFQAMARATEVYRTVRQELNKQVWDFAIEIPFADPNAAETGARR